MTRKYLTETIKRVIRQRVLNEGEPGYEGLSDAEKYKFHANMADRLIMNNSDPHSLHPEARKSILDELSHHSQKAAHFLQRIRK